MVLRYPREQMRMDGDIADILPSPVLVSYWTVNGSQLVMAPLQVEKGEHDPLGTDILAADHLRRNNVESTRDGGEEGKGREHSELHDGRGEDAVVLERERRGGNGAFESIYVKRKRRELASFRQRAK